MDKLNPGLHLALKNFVTAAGSKENLTEYVFPPPKLAHRFSGSQENLTESEKRPATSAMARKSVHGYAIASSQKKIKVQAKNERQHAVSESGDLSRSCSDLRKNVDFDELFNKIGTDEVIQQKK